MLLTKCKNIQLISQHEDFVEYEAGGVFLDVYLEQHPEATLGY